VRELQTWMHAAIVAPRPPSPRDVAKYILPSHTLAPEERLELYRDMYAVRLIEAIEGDYPAVAALLGHRGFHALSAAYIERHPSVSYTLNRLGDHFPQFIAETLPRRRALADLARLELAMTQVFDEEESPLLDAHAIAAVPPHAVASMRLVPIRALRLLAFDYPVNDLFQRFRDDEPLRAPRAKKTWLVVHRRDYGVMRMPLDERAFTLLSALCDGETLGDAVVAFAERNGAPPAQDELFAWFRDWTAAGLFTAIEVEGTK
jgi:hypothetical protein